MVLRGKIRYNFTYNNLNEGVTMKNLKRIFILMLVLSVIGCSNIQEKEEIITPPIKEVIEEKPEIEVPEVVLPEEEVEVEEEIPIIVPEPAKPVIKENPKKEIVILATADVHGRIYPHKYKEFDRDDIGGFAKVSTFVKEMRKKYPDLLLIDMGDAYFYEPFVKTNSPSIIPILNELDYDLFLMGNHELYMSSAYLKEEVAKFNGKAIVNNVYLAKDEEAGVILPGSAVFEVDGIKVAFTGSSIPQKGIRKILLSYEYNISDALPETEKSVKELGGNYDLLVGTFHLNKFGQGGDSGVVEVMEAVDEFHFAFNGHEHVDEGDWTANGKHIIANNAYGITASYAKIQMEQIDGKWTVMSIEPHIVSLSDVESDKEFLQRYRGLHQETIEYVDSGFSGWEKVYHKLHNYIIP